MPSDAALLPAPRVRRAIGIGLIGAIAWRNVWRNRLRTWLSIGGIAFAVMLILAARSAQISTMSGNDEMDRSASASTPNTSAP
ncbi:MAG TPA: hypothetical protein VMJ74_04170 [Pseudomonadales bacterium]|nr:hypothetical protein [Pseudomonadales bacterium]